MEEEKLMEDEAKKQKEKRQWSGGAKISAFTLKLSQKLSQLS